MPRLRGRKGSSRFLTTVLFVDIVGSTELAARSGDAAWEGLLRRYYAMVRDRLRRFHGREIDTAGDGLFAAFDVPANAIECALSIRDAARGSGIEIRAGVHMGETQAIEGKVGGIAVHIGARIAAAAAPGEVLASSTVKDLVTGSRLRFEDRGEAELRGVPERWRLFAAMAPEPEAPLSTGPDASIAGGTSSVADRATWWRRLRAPRQTGVRLAIAAALVVGIGGLGVVAAINLAPKASLTIAPDSIARMDPTGRVVSNVRVGRLPNGIAIADGTVWTTSTTDGTVSRVDATSTAAIQIPVGADPTGIATGFGAIWVANSDGRTVSRINPGTNTVVDTIDVGAAPTGVATDDRWVWVTDRLDGTLVRIDPNGDAHTTYAVGYTPVGVAVATGSVWLTDLDGGVVIRVDAATGAVTSRIRVGNGPTAVAVSPSGDAVWVGNSRDRTLSRVDPQSGSVVAVIDLGGAATGIAVGPNAVWAAVGSKSEMVRIDSASNQIAGRFTLAVNPQAVALDNDAPIFTARVAAGTHVGGTLHIVSSAGALPTDPDPSYVGIDSLAPLLPLTNDALVGYKQVGGSDGLTLVPDLATNLPDPTENGLTYTFQLRPGITYSTGQPVRATDVLHSFERWTLGAAGPFSVADLVGGDACDGKSACDLSRGIVVDDAAGTVTFHLVRADPAFFETLGVWIVPAGTPMAQSTSPLPATGPYMFETFSSTEVRLVRNPHFAVWSPDAQPAGFPDIIDWTPVADGTDPSTLVEAGQADWVADQLSPARVVDIQRRLTDQLHVGPSESTWLELMNTSVAPFNDPRVRQAVNYATDRQAVLQAWGGPLEGRITCQLAPPDYGGYSPYCPYTVLPDGNGTWRGPDMAKALDLIRQAGVAGQKVTVYGLAGPGYRDVTQYFATLLGQLGFDATATTMQLDDYFSFLDAQAGVQMAGYWVKTGRSSVGELVDGGFTCPDDQAIPYQFGAGPPQFCDRTIDAQATKAAELEASRDPAARQSANMIWAGVDRAIVDAAPAVFPFYPTQITFVSSRVGNIQLHPFWQILLDQMWVQ
ncbi:MAG: ABC transporter substrate-binding protein [Candidatus Limnocylindrales bacterium]